MPVLGRVQRVDLRRSDPTFHGMEPIVTERDVALLLLSEESWVRLGAVLALRAQLPDMGSDGLLPPGLPLGSSPSM